MRLLQTVKQWFRRGSRRDDVETGYLAGPDRPQMRDTEHHIRAKGFGASGGLGGF